MDRADLSAAIIQEMGAVCVRRLKVAPPRRLKVAPSKVVYRARPVSRRGDDGSTHWSVAARPCAAGTGVLHPLTHPSSFPSSPSWALQPTTAHETGYFHPRGPRAPARPADMKIASHSASEGVDFQARGPSPPVRSRGAALSTTSFSPWGAVSSAAPAAHRSGSGSLVVSRKARASACRRAGVTAAAPPTYALCRWPATRR